ncbi:periplasmic chaperone for outer membrane proteins Skp [Onishia taeanensis]|uniref:Periplasmic chaperone for outer membrane proteins Skp n=1 Tax=Onishia taeanensis TaxID=284577 RepID=A0A328XW62_9GAMM|nr:OmpH family outer membrane protein [Halomonas taeanensis]RAR63603.1 periplasmic chaperone for outer membrane proteins Skp [Halomonas taeanensis]
MRKLTGALCLGLFAAMSTPALAADIAVLDWRQALLESDDAQQSMSELQNQIGSQQQEAEALGQEVQQLQQRLQRDGATMSESQRQAAVQELQEKGGRFQQLRRQVVQARKQSEQQFMQQAQPRLERAVDQIIERHDIEVLVDRNGVIQAKGDLLDVTDEVTEILNSSN